MSFANRISLQRALANRSRLIHIAHPDPRTSEAISVLFRLEGFQTVYSTDSEDFRSAIERRLPDAAVVSMQIGPEDGIYLLRRLIAIRPSMPVVMLSEGRGAEEAIRAMKAGAADVLADKPINTGSLLRTVTEGLYHAAYLHADGDGQSPSGLFGFSQLTPREREVLELITNGKSNKEAGRDLNISPRTIEVHRARVMEKLGARNTAELVRIVLGGRAT